MKIKELIREFSTMAEAKEYRKNLYNKMAIKSVINEYYQNKKFIFEVVPFVKNA